MGKRGNQTVKKAGGLAAGILVLVIFWGMAEKPEEMRKAVKAGAEIVAGQGMQSLVKDACDPPLAALTFDDGPSAEYTGRLLDGLKERKVQASFFLLGKCLEGNEDLVRRMQREGHLIGNHSFHHVQLNRLSEKEARQEILETNNRIYEITGEYPVYLRPPYGSWDKQTEENLQMIPVFWNLDTLDWKSQNKAAILEAVRNNIRDGAVILMHDEYETTVEAALAVVDEWKQKGYQFVTVDRLILP